MFIGIAFGMGSSLTTKANFKSITRDPLETRMITKYSDTLDKYLNDPDWQTMIKIQYQVINSILTSKAANVDNFDFTNEEEFLNVIGMSKEQYLEKVKINKEAAQRFVTKFKINGSCKTCSLNYVDQINAFKNVLQSFRVSSLKYSNFTKSLQSGDSGRIQGPLCCGFWFYACCATCALSIEIFPLYLACCALCYSSECCS